MRRFYSLVVAATLSLLCSIHIRPSQMELIRIQIFQRPENLSELRMYIPSEDMGEYDQYEGRRSDRQPLPPQQRSLDRQQSRGRLEKTGSRSKMRLPSGYFVVDQQKGGVDREEGDERRRREAEATLPRAPDRIRKKEDGGRGQRGETARARRKMEKIHA